MCRHPKSEGRRHPSVTPSLWASDTAAPHGVRAALEHLSERSSSKDPDKQTSAPYCARRQVRSNCLTIVRIFVSGLAPAAADVPSYFHRPQLGSFEAVSLELKRDYAASET